MENNFPIIGPLIAGIFILAYVLVMMEEKLHLRKSKPVMLAAGIIWGLVALAFYDNPSKDVAADLRHVLLEFAELFLFLLSAMSFVNAMVERNLFESLRTRLVAANLSVRGIFWATGASAFCLSPIADNLTASLVLGTVVVSVLGTKRKETACALVNIVIAANAGGAFSPFGDITTLMVWQKGAVEFLEFFDLFLPALVNWLIPALIIAATMPKEKPGGSKKIAPVYKGGYIIASMFLATIAGTILVDHILRLPPFLGMMTGLGALNLYGYFLHGAETRLLVHEPVNLEGEASKANETYSERKPFNVFSVIEKVEWDTLLFFYGVMLCVGGLSAIGYLEGLSTFLYEDMGSSTANILIGAMSAIVDNIPLTFAVLTMHPVMDHGQWLLLTLCVGVGGSLLSVGSAAGVALMGISKGCYTFMGHLKWSWAIMIGYAASIALHFTLNASLFEK